MWAGPKKGDKIGDTIGEEAGLDRASFSGLVRAVYGLCSRGMSFKTYNIEILFFDILNTAAQFNRTI